MTPSFVISDHSDLADRVPKSFAARISPYLVDPRDAVVVLHIVRAAIIFPMAAAIFLAPPVWLWLLGPLYIAFFIKKVGPHSIMLHLLTHRRLFKRKWRRLDDWVPWVSVLFYGISPGGYKAHHVGMHHPEENMPPDDSTTLGYQRDSAWAFTVYVLRFALLAKIELVRYLRATRKRKLLRRLLLGEVVQKGVFLAALLINWQAALVVFLIPFGIIRFGLMMGNWTEHAFIDPADPGNPYKNSVTMVNCPYNKSTYNDGYHTTHHIKQTAHWADLPTEFTKDYASYVDNDAVVFDGIRGFLVLWILLMRGDYETMARHLVSLGNIPKEQAAKVAWLKARVVPLPTP